MSEKVCVPTTFSFKYEGEQCSLQYILIKHEKTDWEMNPISTNPRDNIYNRHER